MRSAVKARFGFHLNPQFDSSDSAMKPMKNSSSPDLLLKSAARENYFLQSSSYKDKSSICNDGETTSNVGARSFEFREDPSFWKEHNVQVIIRQRPLSSSEISLQGNSRCVKQDSSQSITWTGHPETRFTFDLVADETVSQEMLFRVAGVPMVENCMEGYNSCMFAYGQTGSGKTHTMLGDIEGGTRRHSAGCGMTPRVFEYLFSRIQKDKDARREEKLKFTCRCSFLEIYNEQILDLLDPSSTNLQIREDIKKGVYVENITEIEVTSARDVIQQLLQGAANRKVAATNMNRASSRSHSVFTCIIESKWESQGVTHHRFASLNLVDLAGSERQKSSGAEGERLKEATNINKSLSTLGLVIMNLVNMSNGKSLHVPYRDSKLTFLLQDSLGGNAKTIIIANISPSSCCSLETLSTLKFAQRAKFIKNHAIVNEDASGDVLALRLENQNLKEEVSRLRSLLNGEVENNDGDNMSLAFAGSPGSFKWDAFRGLSSPLLSAKKISHKKEYDVALVGAFQREKDKDAALQALTAENQAAIQLAKQREDEIQGLKMRLRFREAGIKRLEAVASGKISAEAHLLREKEEYLKEIEVLRAQVDRNQEVTRFAMENLRLKEEIRRLKSFCEEGERESMAQQIVILENKLLEALDWKLMHESNTANIQKESSKTVMDIQNDDDFLSSNLLIERSSESPWRTSMNEENEFLRLQAIQNQSEIDSLRKRLEFCMEEKDNLERHVGDLVKEVEVATSYKAVAAEGDNQQMHLPPMLNDQTDIKTMVDAIAAASQREAEAHERAILMSKENDELRIKLKVLLDDNNKLIDLYEKAAAENCRGNCDDNSYLTSETKQEQEELRTEFESLKHQLAEMHEENDKLLSLYEKAMQERDELKRVIASGHHTEEGNKGGGYSCPEKLVEIDGGQCLKFDDDETIRVEISSLEPYVHHDDFKQKEDHLMTVTGSLLEETHLHEVHEDDRDNSSVGLKTNSYSELAEEANTLPYFEVVKVDDRMETEPIEHDMEVIEELKESNELKDNTSDFRMSHVSDGSEQEDNCSSTVNPDAVTNLKEVREKPPVSISVNLTADLNRLRDKLVEAQEKLSYSAETMTKFASLERATIEVDALVQKIGKLEHSIRAKQQESSNLKSLTSELQKRKDLAENKLLALKNSLTSFTSSLCYFEQRENLARTRLNASFSHLIERKEELSNLKASRKELVESVSKLQQTETEVKNSVESLKLKIGEENKKLESDRVLFAIDNVDKAADLSQKIWQTGGKATELLKSEEEKTKLQNQIKLNREKLVQTRKEVEVANMKLSKVDVKIERLQVELQHEAATVDETERKLQCVVQEKEMLLEIKENAMSDFECMIIEYHQSLFETGVKEEEMKMVDEELTVETQKIEGFVRAKAEAMRRKTELVEAMSCNSLCFSDQMETDLQCIQVAVAQVNFLLLQF